MGEAVEELNLAAHRLQRFVEGETARTIYKLPPGGRFDPMRRDVAALLSAITRAEAQKEGSTASQGAARLEDGWQPIETAPKDGTTVDLYGSHGRVASVRWTRGLEVEPDCPPHLAMDGWRRRGERRGNVLSMFEPTHWRPLPDPPALSSQGAGRLRDPRPSPFDCCGGPSSCDH